jgi:hypothetical protein
MFVYILAAMLIALQIGDWWTTRRALASGQDHEGNPIMAWLIAKIGFAPAFIAKGVAISLAGIAATQMAAGVWALIIAVAVYVWIVWHNYALVKVSS